MWRVLKMDRVQFIQQVVKIHPEIRFQYWFYIKDKDKFVPSKTWYTYDKVLKKHSKMFLLSIICS